MSASSHPTLAQGYSELERKLGLEQNKSLEIKGQCAILKNEKEDLLQKVSFHIGIIARHINFKSSN